MGLGFWGEEGIRSARFVTKAATWSWAWERWWSLKALTAEEVNGTVLSAPVVLR